jgi:riboflavin kinase/FMN adenylyltransferase
MTPALVQDWRAVPEALRGATVALGNFDGVHLGHAAVIRAAHGARPDLPLAALTFEPHPREHFRPDDPPFRLTLLPAKAAALGGLGVGAVYALPFGAALAAMPAEAFVEEVLHQGIGARHLTCGHDFAFGHRRGGDIGLLAREAEKRGIGLTVVPAVGDEGGPISSTRIRRLLQDGYPERAARELGRDWEITGTVFHGDRLGRELGWPTANILLGAGARRGECRPPPDARGRPGDQAGGAPVRLVRRSLRAGDRRAAAQLPPAGRDLRDPRGAQGGDRGGCGGGAARAGRVG